jgi:hypothetical protein
MSMLEINWNPSQKDLTWFSLFGVGAGLLLATLLYTLKGVALPWCLGMAGAGVGIGLSRLISITLTRWIYCAMMGVTLPIGMTVSYTLMAVFYYLLLTPLALVFRLIGRDPLNRQFDRDASSYWLPHQQTVDKKRYFQQF